MKQAQKKNPVAAKPKAQESPAAKVPKAAARGKDGEQDSGGGKGAATGGKGAGAGHAYVPDTIAQGSSGAEVRMLQILLAKNGLEPGPIDGVFGPLTHGAIIRFQMKKGLEVDGIVGKNTWGALREQHPGTAPEKQAGIQKADKKKADKKATGDKKGTKDKPRTEAKGGGGAQKPAAKPGGKKDTDKGKATIGKEAKARADILKIAGAEIGTTESGENRGGAMKYQKAFGRGPEPWCADFVSWVMTKAGIKTNSPYCPTFIQQLKKQGRWKGQKNPELGDIVFFDWGHDGKADHVGLVKKVNNDGSITTIEGNTGHPKTGQEGVWQKTRYKMQIVGFGDIA